MKNNQIKFFCSILLIVFGILFSSNHVLAFCEEEEQALTTANEELSSCNGDINCESTKNALAILARRALVECRERTAAIPEPEPIPDQGPSTADAMQAALEPAPPVAEEPGSNNPPKEAQKQTGPTVYTSKLNVPLGKLGEFTVGGNILGLYLQYWYGFLIGTIGILAAIMIMAGGFLYLTSGGDKGKAGEGQKMITSAITGIVLAFGVYTILYLVNPELLKIKIPSINPITVDKFDLPKLSGSAGTPQAGQGLYDQSTLCATGRQVIDYSKLTYTDFGCNDFTPEQNQYFDKYGTPGLVDSDTLRAIAMAESSGNPNEDNAGKACGLMQLNPETATTLNDGVSVSCEQLKSDQELSIKLAAKLLNLNRTKFGTNDLIAGYNAGYDRTPGSGHALSPSQDCGPQYMAYQCCTNAGGLAKTQDYVQRVHQFYTCYSKQ